MTFCLCVLWTNHETCHRLPLLLLVLHSHDVFNLSLSLSLFIYTSNTSLLNSIQNSRNILIILSHSHYILLGFSNYNRQDLIYSSSFIYLFNVWSVVVVFVIGTLCVFLPVFLYFFVFKQLSYFFFAYRNHTNLSPSLSFSHSHTIIMFTLVSQDLLGTLSLSLSIFSLLSFSISVVAMPAHVDKIWCMMAVNGSPLVVEVITANDDDDQWSYFIYILYISFSQCIYIYMFTYVLHFHSKNQDLSTQVIFGT